MNNNLEHFQAIQMEDLKNRKEAYTALFNALGPEHFSTLEAEFNYAMALSVDGKEDECRSHLENVWLGVSENIEMAYYADLYYEVVYNYALSLFNNNESLKAIPPLLQALSASPDRDKNDDIIIDLNFLLTDCLEDCERFEEAKLTLKLVYDRLMYFSEPGDYNTLQTVIRYSTLLNRIGENKKALTFLNKHRKECDEWGDMLAVLITTIFRASIAKGTNIYSREVNKAKKLINSLSMDDYDFPAENFIRALEMIDKGEEPDFFQ